MVAAGIFFGAWPLLMNRSGLHGLPAAILLSGFTTVCVVTVGMLTNNISFTGIHWGFALSAGATGAIGLIVFNAGLANATPAVVGKLFIMMILVQTAIPAVYHTIVNQHLDAKTGAGLLAAFTAAYLLKQ